jgi:hypothetical protein
MSHTSGGSAAASSCSSSKTMCSPSGETLNARTNCVLKALSCAMALVAKS